MEKLRFQPGTGTADPDQRVLSDQDLEQAIEEGKQKDQASRLNATGSSEPWAGHVTCR